MATRIGRRSRRILQVLFGGIALQATSCSFDGQEFFDTAVSEIAGNSTTLFVTTLLADILKVTPSFSFF